MRRWAFVVGVTLATLAMPFAGEAQQAGKIPVVGVLLPNLLDKAFPAFLKQLGELGYEDGRNLRLVIRSADAKLDRLPGLAAELVAMKPDVIVAINTPPTREAIKATKDIPIVMGIVGDPIGTGFVSNLPHPGGNVTGISNQGGDTAAKRLQLLKELAAGAGRVAVLFNPDDPVTTPQIRETERAAPLVGVEIRFFPVRAQDGLIAAFSEMTGWRADAVQWLGGQEFAFVPATVDFALKQHLPTMVPQRQQVQGGALMSYNADRMEQLRHVAIYVDKILKGAKPGDLPVEQPTKFEFVVNLKTAQALGITVPQSILARADEVIE
jgi:putative tryptophan/tyrosine transport system substrate-binding protein